MKQYLELCKRVLDEGVWVENERTGKRCLTVINADLEYDVSDGTLPVLTTKKMHWRPAIAEMLGYLKGYSNAADFRALGCNTWNANANENAAWLANPFRKGEDDMGRCYGPQIRDWQAFDGRSIDQLRKVYNDLCVGKDDRREIVTFWNPGELELGCLAACMHTHTFSILDGTLYLTSYQRSDDLALGHPFNQIQVGWLLLVMARITGLMPGVAYHKIVNVHLYEDQVELMREQVTRTPGELPKLQIRSFLNSLKDLEAQENTGDFNLFGYEHQPAIKYPFSV